MRFRVHNRREGWISIGLISAESDSTQLNSTLSEVATNHAQDIRFEFDLVRYSITRDL